MRAWQQWESLRDRAAVRSWLFQIALRTLLADARRNMRREQLVPVMDLEPEFVELVASPAPTSLELLIERASDDAVWAALRALPRELGLALELYEVEELSYAEVATAWTQKEDDRWFGARVPKRVARVDLLRLESTPAGVLAWSHAVYEGGAAPSEKAAARLALVPSDSPGARARRDWILARTRAETPGS